MGITFARSVATSDFWIGMGFGYQDRRGSARGALRDIVFLTLFGGWKDGQIIEEANWRAAREAQKGEGGRCGAAGSVRNWLSDPHPPWPPLCKGGKLRVDPVYSSAQPRTPGISNGHFRTCAKHAGFGMLGVAFVYPQPLDVASAR